MEINDTENCNFGNEGGSSDSISNNSSHENNYFSSVDSNSSFCTDSYEESDSDESIKIHARTGNVVVDNTDDTLENIDALSRSTLFEDSGIELEEGEASFIEEENENDNELDGESCNLPPRKFPHRQIQE